MLHERDSTALHRAGLGEVTQAFHTQSGQLVAALDRIEALGSSVRVYLQHVATAAVERAEQALASARDADRDKLAAERRAAEAELMAQRAVRAQEQAEQDRTTAQASEQRVQEQARQRVEEALERAAAAERRAGAAAQQAQTHSRQVEQEVSARELAERTLVEVRELLGQRDTILSQAREDLTDAERRAGSAATQLVGAQAEVRRLRERAKRDADDLEQLREDNRHGEQRTAELLRQTEQDQQELLSVSAERDSEHRRVQELAARLEQVQGQHRELLAALADGRYTRVVPAETAAESPPPVP